MGTQVFKLNKNNFTYITFFIITVFNSFSNYLIVNCQILENYDNFLKDMTKTLLYNTTSGVHQAKLILVDEKSAVAKLSFVPYGEKPERFKQAVLKKYVPGTHMNDEPVVCYQVAEMSSYGLFQIKHAPKMSEDCLTITIYMPLSEKQQTNLSTVIHIHGGSNFVGGSSLFDGSVLAAHGNVMVAIVNFRLGIMGFMSDGTEKYPGNYGLRDQVLALKWLKMNCKVLNCNPDAITLWGQFDFKYFLYKVYSKDLFIICSDLYQKNRYLK